jgi:hypothetical protein
MMVQYLKRIPQKKLNIRFQNQPIITNAENTYISTIFDLGLKCELPLATIGV